MKRLQAGDIDYKEAMAASAIRNKIEVDGIKAEQNASVLKVCSSHIHWSTQCVRLCVCMYVFCATSFTCHT